MQVALASALRLSHLRSRRHCRGAGRRGSAAPRPGVPGQQLHHRHAELPPRGRGPGDPAAIPPRSEAEADGLAKKLDAMKSIEGGKELVLEPGTEMLLRTAAPARTRD